jgi:hypothetical protein
LFASVLVVLNVLSIFNVPITHDETGYSAHHSYTDLIVNRYASANNHVLHSLIRKFLVEYFTDSLFFLRADSLVAQVIFLLSTYGICSLLTLRRWLGLAGFVLLNVVSPLLFQFWGLSRGYGLALALLSVSVLYLLRYINAGRSYFLIVSLIAAILSVYSIFSFINFYLAVCGVTIVHRMLFGRSAELRTKSGHEFLLLLASAVVLAALITVPLFNVYGHDGLQFMGTNGFWADTVSSLLKEAILISNSTKDTIKILGIVIAVFSVLPSVYWFVLYIKTVQGKVLPNRSLQIGVVLYLLFFIPAVSVILQHALFGINYVIDRTALFFIPLFFIHLVHWLNHIVNGHKILGTIIGLVFFGAGCYNFCSNANVTHTHLWWYNAADNVVLERIKMQHKGARMVKVCVGWIHEPSFMYNAQHYFPGQFTIAGSGAANKDTAINYYYVSVSEADQLPAGFFRDTVYVGGAFALYRRTVTDKN